MVSDDAKITTALNGYLVGVRLPPAAEPPAPRPDGNLHPEVGLARFKILGIKNPFKIKFLSEIEPMQACLLTVTPLGTVTLSGVSLYPVIFTLK